MNRLITILLCSMTIVVVINSCRKDDEPSPQANPYNDPSLWPPPDTTTPVKLDSGSFQYLYHYVFKPTCANSGCHDGNFPPDFRTVYSSYNTMVKHPVIQNDPQGSFSYRVEPGNVEKSLLYERLTNFMPNTSGIMPLSLEPDSDWPDKKDLYIQMIADWIAAGAPDTYGNVPGEATLNPQVVGILAFPQGTTMTPLPREDNRSDGPIIIPKAPIDVWFAFSDDKTDPADFTYTGVKSSRMLFDFDNAENFGLANTTAINGQDFWGQSVSYTHKATLSFPSDTSNTFIYLRTYIQENSTSDTTEVPNQGTSENIRAYFTLKVDSL